MAIQPSIEKVRERATPDDLKNPGDFCYKKLAVAGTPQEGTRFVTTVIINCPFCNRTQHLGSHTILYRGRLKRWINDTCLRIFRWQPFHNINSSLTIKQDIGCAFNKLHQYRIDQNKIELA